MTVMSPRRGRNPALVVLVIAFGLLGIVCFQIVRERRASSALLQEMTDEKIKARRKLEEANDVADDLRQTVLRLRLENEKLLVEKNNLHKQLIELEHEKSSSENEKQDLLENFQAKKEEIDMLKQQLEHQQQNEAEVVSLKLKLDSLEKDLESAAGNQIQDTRKLAVESNTEKTKEGRDLTTEKSSYIKQETLGADSSSDADEPQRDGAERHSSMESDEKEWMEEEKGQREGFKGEVLVESRDLEGDGQADESEHIDGADMNNPDKDAEDLREELSVSTQENGNQKDEAHETESLNEQDTSNSFLNADDISDQEAHLGSLESKLDHEIDQDDH